MGFVQNPKNVENLGVIFVDQVSHSRETKDHRKKDVFSKSPTTKFQPWAEIRPLPGCEPRTETGGS